MGEVFGLLWAVHLKLGEWFDEMGIEGLLAYSESQTLRLNPNLSPAKGKPQVHCGECWSR